MTERDAASPAPLDLEAVYFEMEGHQACCPIPHDVFDSLIAEVRSLRERLKSAEAKIARVRAVWREWPVTPDGRFADLIDAALADAESEEPHA